MSEAQNTDGEHVQKIYRNGRLYDQLDSRYHAVIQMARGWSREMPNDHFRVTDHKGELLAEFFPEKVTPIEPKKKEVLVTELEPKPEPELSPVMRATLSTVQLANHQLEHAVLWLITLGHQENVDRLKLYRDNITEELSCTPLNAAKMREVFNLLAEVVESENARHLRHL